MLPDFAKFICCAGITLFLYSVLGYCIPVHMLRKINGKTVLISSLFTITTIFIPQILSFYFSNCFNANRLTTNNIVVSLDMSRAIKSMILDNPKLIDFINYLLEREMLGQVNTTISLITSTLTISYIIGGLIINHKIKKSKSRAKSIFRNLTLGNTKANYQLLIQCSFYGGEEYENLILNNESLCKVVLENESEIEIPDDSLKTRLIMWWRKFYPITF
jgi:hypothetical protein